MLTVMKRIFNGVRMPWAVLLFTLRYPVIIGYGVIASLYESLLSHIFQVKNPLLFSNGATLSQATIAWLYILVGTFITIAKLKYMLAALNKNQPHYEMRDSFTHTIRQWLVVTIWSIIICSFYLVKSFGSLWIDGLLILPVILLAFFSERIAENTTPWQRMVPESLKLIKAYWPELTGLIILKATIMLFLFHVSLLANLAPTSMDVINPAHLTSPMLDLYLILQVILNLGYVGSAGIAILQHYRGRNVGEDFAPYFRS